MQLGAGGAPARLCQCGQSAWRGQVSAQARLGKGRFGVQRCGYASATRAAAEVRSKCQVAEKGTPCSEQGKNWWQRRRRGRYCKGMGHSRHTTGGGGREKDGRRVCTAVPHEGRIGLPRPPPPVSAAPMSLALRKP